MNIQEAQPAKPAPPPATPYTNLQESFEKAATAHGYITAFGMFF